MSDDIHPVFGGETATRSGERSGINMAPIRKAMARVMRSLVMKFTLLTGALIFATTLMLIGTMGVLGTGAHLLMTWSLRFAPSATLAPMQYLEIPVSTLIGWLIFRDLPNGLAAVGIAVTIAAGLYIITRERTIARRLRGPAVP